MKGIVLAGGQSRRMGRNKALLPYRDTTLIEWVVARLESVLDEVYVVTKTPECYPFPADRLIRDQHPVQAALIGLYAGLAALREPRVFVAACDMPLIEPRAVSLLCDHSEDCDVTIPAFGEYVEPLHAVYADSCLPSIERKIAANQLKVASFFPLVRVRRLDASFWQRHGIGRDCFLNINSLEDWQRLVGREE